MAKREVSGTSQRTRSSPPAVITFPPESPSDVIQMLNFTQSMEVRLARLRNEGSLPRAALMLPERFNGVGELLYQRLRAQATEALNRGEPVVACWVERSADLHDLIDWTSPRLDLIDGIVRAGLVTPHWERPWMMLMSFWRSAYRQIKQPAR